MSQFVAPHVLRSEMQCRHCQKLPIGMAEDYENMSMIYTVLFERFEDVRREWGKPITITSGFRCPTYNRSIGGTLMSAHMFGLALDLDVGDAENTAKLAKVIEDICPEVRMGVYLRDKTFVHVDTAWLIMPQVEASWVEGMRWGDARPE